jgi:integrase
MYIRTYKKGFRCEVYVNGQRASETFSTKKEASEWGRIMEVTLSNAEVVTEQYTLQDAVNKYVQEVSPKKSKPAWEALRLAAMVRYFKPETKLSQITQPVIAKWRDDRLQEVKAGSVLRDANLLRNVFTVARLEWNWIDHRPFDGVKLPNQPEPRHQRWSWQQIKRVVRRLGYVTGAKPETKGQEVALAFMIGLRTSLRAAEILRINETTYNHAKRVIIVKAKGRLRSEIPVTMQGARLCRLANFTIGTGSLDSLFRSARDQVLISDLTFHDGRATALTMLARKYDILTLARISQHSDLRMMQRYYRESSEEIAARL